MLFNGRNEGIELYNDYSLMILEAKKRVAEKQGGRGLKILTPKKNPSKTTNISCKSKSW